MIIDKIYNENCLDTMKRMISDGQKADIILTSPPYHHYKDVVLKGIQMYDEYSEKDYSDDEYIKFITDIFDAFNKILSENAVILFNYGYGRYANLFYKVLCGIIDRGFTIADRIVWVKTNCIPLNTSPNRLSRICEDVFVICRTSESLTFKTAKKVLYNNGMQNFYNGYLNLIKAPNNDECQSLNKATFSTELVMKLLNMYCYSKDLIVYDPFMGTGTTANGCIKFGCHYIGSEISSKQCEYAEQRISKIRNNMNGLEW